MDLRLHRKTAGEKLLMFLRLTEKSAAAPNLDRDGGAVL